MTKNTLPGHYPWFWGAYMLLALGLLVCTLCWRVPMMLWDHLDLLPIYQSWQSGTLLGSDVLSVHDGSHMHTAAYAVLLVTTTLSGGQTWLDCLVSWGLLLVYAGIVMRMARRSIGEQARPWQWLLLVFLALYPGHLANLQWGWQVAVFLCLVGCAAAIALLSGPGLSWPKNMLAMVAAVLAYFSFATGMALVPVAVILIALRRDFTIPGKVAMTIPWLLLGLLAVGQYATLPGSSGLSSNSTVLELCHYALNFIGAGALRFATDVAPWLALLGIATAGWAFFMLKPEQRSSPWLGFVLFGVFAALATALGRAGPFGAEHAFVQRYVSFSSVFWLGWLGMMMTVSDRAISSHASGKRRKWLSALMVAVAVFLVANALHLMKKAERVAVQARQTAATIAATYPNVDDAVLRDIYFDQAAIARERLDMLKRYSFAPFQPPPADKRTRSESAD